MKLYQKLFRAASDLLVEEKQESLIYNPVEAKVGGTMMIDDIDYVGLTFVIKKIKEFAVGRNKFTDYELLARPIDGEDVRLKLRISPNEDGYSLLLLRLYHESPFDQGLYDVVRHKDMKFVIDQESLGIHEEFWRVHDIHSSHKATVKVLRDVDGDGKVRADEVVTTKLEFWDFSRMTVLDEVELEEFLFVEMDNDAMFQIWRGTAINSERVEI